MGFSSRTFRVAAATNKLMQLLSRCFAEDTIDLRSVSGGMRHELTRPRLLPRAQHVCKYACSEEVPEPVDMEGEGFSVAFDPLDGSSIVDTNFTVRPDLGTRKPNH